MTLLTACQTVLREIGDYERLTSIATNTSNDTAQQLLALANRTGKELARKYDWQSLLGTYTFLTVASTAAYALPADWRKFANMTTWDRSNFWEMVGPATPRQWQVLQSSIAAPATTRRWFRIQGDMFNIFPTPTASNETIAYDYYSNSWCESAGGSPQTAFAADTDVSRLDEDILILGVKYRFLKAQGHPFDDEYNEYQQALGSSRVDDTGLDSIDLNTHGTSAFVIGGSNLPESGFG